MPRTGMHRQSGGFVEHDQVLVFVHDIQWAGSGHHAAETLRGRQAHRDGLAHFGNKTGIDPDSVHQDAVLQPLDPPHHRAGQEHMLFQKGVYPCPFTFGWDHPVKPPRHQRILGSTKLRTTKDRV